MPGHCSYLEWEGRRGWASQETYRYSSVQLPFYCPREWDGNRVLLPNPVSCVTLFFMVLYGIPAAVLALDTTDVVDTLETMRVSASVSAPARPSSETLEAVDFQGLFVDLPSLLNTVSGLTVRRSGGVGSYSEVSIRGSAAKQVEIFLDGVPLNSGLDGAAVNIGRIPLAGLSRVTVYKGVVPLSLSGFNAAGAVDIRSDPVKPAASASVEFGSYGRFESAALLSGSTVRAGALVTVDALGGEGEFPFLFDNGTQYSTLDDKNMNMDNNQYSLIRTTVGGHVSTAKGSRLVLGSSFSHSDRGIFYYATAGSNNGSERRSELTFSEQITASPISGTSLVMGLSQRHSQLLFERDGLYYYGSNHRKVETRNWGVDASLLFLGSMTDLFEYQLMLGAMLDSYERDNLLVDSKRSNLPRAGRLIGSGGVELVWAPSKTLVLRGQYVHRYEIDTVNQFFSDSAFDLTRRQRTGTHRPTGSLSASYSLFPSLMFHGEGGVASLSPSLHDRFSIAPGFIGTDSLKAETRYRAELGVAFNKDKGSLSLTGFWSSSRDKIVYIASRLNLVTPINLGRVDGGGIEANIDWWPTRFLELHSRTTLMQNTIRSRAFNREGNWEPLVPRLTESVRLAVIPRYWIQIEQMVMYRSRYYLNADNTETGPAKDQKAAPYLDLLIRLCPFPAATVTYRLENYLDIRNYDFRDSPRPGRTHSVNLALDFTQLKSIHMKHSRKRQKTEEMP